MEDHHYHLLLLLATHNNKQGSLRRSDPELVGIRQTNKLTTFTERFFYNRRLDSGFEQT